MNCAIKRLQMLRERSIRAFKLVTRFDSYVAISRLINHVIKSKKIHSVFHASLLEIYHESTILGRSQPTPPSVEIDGCEEYEVKSILDSRIQQGKLEYFVHWRSYPINERTSEPASNLSNALEKIQIFHHQHPMQPRTNHRFYIQKIKLLEGSRS